MLAEVPEFKLTYRRLWDKYRNNPLIKDIQAEWLWRKKLEHKYVRSGRLKMIEEVGPIAEGQAKGVMRVLALCACGNTKVVQLRDLVKGRAYSCSANCRHRLTIRHPHRSRQRIHSRKTGKLIRLGSPKWDPVLRKGIFEEREKAMSTSAKKSYNSNWPTGKSYGGVGPAPDSKGSGADPSSKADSDRMTDPYPEQPGYTAATAPNDAA
jgi:hypothetical protein